MTLFLVPRFLFGLHALVGAASSFVPLSSPSGTPSAAFTAISTATSAGRPVHVTFRPSPLRTATPDADAASREIYGVPGSGWASPEWNWGYASGTGHDCAMICRRRWGAADARAALVDALLDPPAVGESSATLAAADAARDPPFEEVKLVLGLAWQRGRRDGSDGGRGGYGDVLAEMARAERYEPSDDPSRSRALVEDMRRRFRLIASGEEELGEMNAIDLDGADLDAARRRCAGLVLRAMGFVRNGL